MLIYNINKFKPTTNLASTSGAIDRRGVITYIALLVLAGAILNNLVVPIFTIIAVNFINRGKYFELFVGFYIVLILSDSMLHYLGFAIMLKPIYMIMLFLPFFFKTRGYIFCSQYSLHVYFLPFFIFSLFCIVYSPIPFTSLQKSFSYILLFSIIPLYLHSLHAKYGDAMIKVVVYVGVSAIASVFYYSYSIQNMLFIIILVEEEGSLVIQMA